MIKGDVYVSNTMGQLIMQQKLSGENQTKTTLNASTGNYLGKVATNENVFQQRCL